MGELAHEVSLCLRYYSVTFRGQRPARVRLLGGEANDRGLRDALATSLVVPVEIYEPLQGIDHELPVTPGQPLCEWGVAFGAAMRCLKSTVSREHVPAFGRRQDDASLVEVVDLTASLQSAQSVAETAGKPREPDHA
jgi:hypothetical protein